MSGTNNNDGGFFDTDDGEALFGSDAGETSQEDREIENAFQDVQDEGLSLNLPEGYGDDDEGGDFFFDSDDNLVKIESTISVELEGEVQDEGEDVADHTVSTKKVIQQILEVDEDNIIVALSNAVQGAVDVKQEEAQQENQPDLAQVMQQVQEETSEHSMQSRVDAVRDIAGQEVSVTTVGGGLLAASIKDAVVIKFKVNGFKNHKMKVPLADLGATLGDAEDSFTQSSVLLVPPEWVKKIASLGSAFKAYVRARGTLCGVLGGTIVPLPLIKEILEYRLKMVGKYRELFDQIFSPEGREELEAHVKVISDSLVPYRWARERSLWDGGSHKNKTRAPQGFYEDHFNRVLAAAPDEGSIRNAGVDVFFEIFALPGMTGGIDPSKISDELKSALDESKKKLVEDWVEALRRSLAQKIQKNLETAKRSVIRSGKASSAARSIKKALDEFEELNLLGADSDQMKDLSEIVEELKNIFSNSKSSDTTPMMIQMAIDNALVDTEVVAQPEVSGVVDYFDMIQEHQMVEIGTAITEDNGNEDGDTDA